MCGQDSLRSRAAAMLTAEVLACLLAGCGGRGYDNKPPTAEFAVEPSAGTTETVFQFDGSGCTDPETPSSALRVRWDWEGDGVFDTGFAAAKLVVHQYTSPGSYGPTIQVEDEEGLRSTFRGTITVIRNEGDVGVIIR